EAGWAHSVLFAADLKAFATRLTETKIETSTVKGEPGVKDEPGVKTEEGTETKVLESSAELVTVGPESIKVDRTAIKREVVDDDEEDGKGKGKGKKVFEVEEKVARPTRAAKRRKR
ncbi:MAG: hypothetical protein M4579_007688, partial [Chaenotheca gracillima]